MDNTSSLQIYYIHRDRIVFVAVLAAWGQLPMEEKVASLYSLTLYLFFLNCFWLVGND